MLDTTFHYGFVLFSHTLQQPSNLCDAIMVLPYNGKVKLKDMVDVFRVIVAYVPDL